MQFCEQSVHLSKMLTRYDVSISHRLSQMSVLKSMTFCVCEIGRFYLDYTGFVCSFVKNHLDYKGFLCMACVSCEKLF